MRRKWIFIIACATVIFLMLFWYIGMPENKANRILKSMMHDYEKIEEIIFTGFVDLGEQEVMIGESQYYLIQGECKNLNDLEKLLNKVYTKEMVKGILSWSMDGDDPIIIEHEGGLYRKDAYATGNSFILPIKAIEKVSKEEMKVKAVSANNEAFIVCITLKREEGKWKISEIKEMEGQ